MISLYTQLAYYSWLALFIVWLIGYFNTKRIAKIPNRGEQVVVFVLLVSSYILLFSQHDLPSVLDTKLYTVNPTIGWIGVVLSYLGVLFAIWARIALGSNWSGTVVSIKKDHELVQNGPYAYVRHPIYSGFLAGALGTALTIGSIGASLAIIIMLAAFLIRVRREELMMKQQFPDAYQAYKTRTKALVPFLL